MKNSYRAILIFFLSFIVLAGLALFIFRLQALDWLRGQSGLTAPIATSSELIVISAKDSLDLSILKMPRFMALADNVVNFDFDNICRRASLAAGSDISVITTTATKTSVAPASCVQGNNLPFFKKK